MFGGNTRTALAKWVQGQRDRITQIQGEVATVRAEATKTVKMERFRLAGVVKDIREVQIPALKERELVMLGKIDDVRKDESPIIQTARDEIQRLRESAEAQVVNSQSLIERLRSQLAQTDKADEIDAAVEEQLLKIKVAEAEVDVLTENKYKLEGEYRMLEAEVGPIKYIAEFVYGEAADNTMLEEAVRWVILIIIFVFDPLAVLLLIASQYTFDFVRRNKDDDGDRLRLQRDYEQARAQKIVDNIPPNNDPATPDEEVPKFQDVDQETLDKEEENDLDKWNDWVETANKEAEKEVEQPVEKKNLESSEDSVKSSDRLTEEQLNALDNEPEWKDAKQRWKDDHPNDTIKNYKTMYLKGIISKLPWESYLTQKEDDNGYIQNAEQSQQSIWSRIKKDNE